MKIARYFVVAFLCICNICSADSDVVILHHKDNLNVEQSEIDNLWRFIKKITNAENAPPPQTHFIPFNIDKDWKLWRDWQERWKKRMRMEDNPPWKSFDGLYYKGTVVIQIDPQLYSVENPNDNTTVSARFEGNRKTGHEMLHYIFGLRGVPSFLEHCVMDTGGFEDSLILHVYGYTNGVSNYKGICETTPKKLIECGIKQVLEAPMHPDCFK